MKNNPPRHRFHEPRGRAPGRPLSAARRAILDRLLDQPEPLTLASLVTITGLHENTVREHLTALVHRGIVRCHRSEPAGRGRPALRYELAEDDDPEGSQYAGLAAALASSIVRTSEDPAGTGMAAGEEWGHALARERTALPLTPLQARTETLRLLDDIGYEPRTQPQRPDRVDLTRCPLLEAAHRHQEVVYAVHLGIVRGALEEHGADPEGTDLLPFVEPGACLLVMPPLDQDATSDPSGAAT